MFQPHEIVARFSPALTEQLFAFLYDKERKLYRATIESLAKQRNFRPVFVEKMPAPKRHTWMKEQLGKVTNGAVAAHVLQIFFVGGHSALLCDFLDALGIKHDDNGTIEELPPAPDKEAVKKAVDAVMEKHDPALVTAYLHTFQALDDAGGWPSLEELLAEEERLKL